MMLRTLRETNQVNDQTFEIKYMQKVSQKKRNRSTRNLIEQPQRASSQDIDEIEISDIESRRSQHSEKVSSQDIEAESFNVESRHRKQIPSSAQRSKRHHIIYKMQNIPIISKKKSKVIK